MKGFFSILSCFLVLAALAACSTPKAASGEQVPQMGGITEAAEKPASLEETVQETTQPEEQLPAPEPTGSEEPVMPEPIAIWEGEPDMDEPPEGAAIHETTDEAQYVILGRFGYQWTSQNPRNPDERVTVCADGIAPWDEAAVLPEVADAAQVRLLWQAQPTRVNVKKWFCDELANDPENAHQTSVPLGEGLTIAAPTKSAVVAVQAEWEGYGDALYAFRWIISE